MKNFFKSIYLFFSIPFELVSYFIKSFFLTENEQAQIHQDIEDEILKDLLMGGK